MFPDLLARLADVPDPRMARTRLHPLTTILGIALCAVICGADTYAQIEEYGRSKHDWLASWLPMPNGVPSQDTFARVLARLPTSALGECLQALTQTLADGDERQIAIDGKYLRHSFDTGKEQGALVMLNAWASEQRLVLASVPVAQKSNEIKAVPALLSLLDIRGATVTLDAMGCQTAIAEQIVAQGGDYVLALKGNQEKIHDDCRALFAFAIEKRWEDRPHDYVHTCHHAHGRKETRRLWQVNLGEWHGLWADAQQKWHGLASLLRLECERQVGNKPPTTEVRYYLSSLSGDAGQALGAIRRHWGVENSLHWVLDVAFDEDSSRIRTGYAPANVSLLRQMALNLLRQEKTCKAGIAVKRSKAGWDNAYLLRVLNSCSQV